MRISHWGLLAAAGIVCPRPVQAQFTVPTAKLTQDLKIDGVNEDFVQLGAVFVASDGRIGITQPRDNKGILYTSSGKRICAFGGTGDGPGEFRSMGSAAWIGDTVWASEPRTRRFSTFSSDCKLVMTHSLGAIAASSLLKDLPPTASYSTIAVYADGSVLAARSAPSREDPPTVIVTISPRDEIQRVVMRHPQDAAAIHQKTSTGGEFFTSVPFVNEIQDIFAPNGNRVGYLRTVPGQASGKLDLLVLGLHGDTIVSKSYTFKGVPIPAAVKDSVIAARVKQRTGPGTTYGPNGVQQVASLRVPQADLDAYEHELRMRIPPTYGPVVTAKFGLDNTIWVQSFTTDATVSWTMLTERGEPLLKVILPKRARLNQANSTTLWVTEFDDDDIPSVVRYRISK